jgi:DNA-directed RNA polymerase specialized sigma subunit
VTIATPQSPPIDVDEALDRTVEYLANLSARCPTVDEIADASGLRPEDVLESLEVSVAARPAPGMFCRRALYLRCVAGLDRAAIAQELGVCRLQVSRFLRGATEGI